MANAQTVASPVLTAGNVDRDRIALLASRYNLEVAWLPLDAEIPGSFWGAPEAGLIERRIFARHDTPVHSILHELCHVVCMDDERRQSLHRDAGGDDMEEAAVCYLQVLLSDYLPDVGAERLMHDMDSWGYSFRLGSTSRWFEMDARDAREWLVATGIISSAGVPTFNLRRD